MSDIKFYDDKIKELRKRMGEPFTTSINPIAIEIDYYIQMKSQAGEWLI